MTLSTASSLAAGGASGAAAGAEARRRWARITLGRARRRAAVAFAVFALVWQVAAVSGHAWAGALPWAGNLPAPTEVARAWSRLLVDPGYWQSTSASSWRVLVGFSAAVAAGVPFGLLLSTSRRLRRVVWPVFELLRPIPPLAWVPAAIIFWPTQELSIDFVIFLGAFYTIVINTLGGADAMDPRLVQVARSMGASRWNVFRRLVLPAALPSVLVGMEVGIGITWEVVVAAEMISGGGAGSSSSSGGGLGFFIWNSYVGGSYPQIVVGMISIGVAGHLSSATLRLLASRFTRWRRAH